MNAGPSTKERTYDRRESKAQQLDRNWSELVQELRVLGAGVQILFAFLLTISFQARWPHTSGFQRDVYLVVLMTAAMAASALIAPVALHRFVFRFGVKDELVDVSTRMAVVGLLFLAATMIGSVLLVSDWVAGTVGAVICTTLAALVVGGGWFALAIWLRRRARAGSEPLNRGPA